MLIPHTYLIKIYVVKYRDNLAKFTFEIYAGSTNLLQEAQRISRLFVKLNFVLLVLSYSKYYFFKPWRYISMFKPSARKKNVKREIYLLLTPP